MKKITAMLLMFTLLMTYIPVHAASSADSSQKQTRAAYVKEVRVPIYWGTKPSSTTVGKYHVGYTTLKVSYGYNAITQTGTVNAVEVATYEPYPDFYVKVSSTYSGNRIMLKTQNLEPANAAEARTFTGNTFTFSVTASGNINYSTKISGCTDMK